MKKIDAHAHLGYIGGWANVKMDVDELISLMDTYEIETTMICVLDNEVAYKAMQKYPGRIEGCVYVNPLEPNCLDLIDKYNLAGASYWVKDYEQSNIWNVINEKLNNE